MKFIKKKKNFMNLIKFSLNYHFELFVSLGSTKVTLCGNKKRTISCPAGSNIRVFTAFYGRSNRKTCRGVVRTLRCSAKNALAKIRGQCDGRRSCSVYASHTVFGDPCRGTSKYLELSYACQGKF